MMLGNSKLIKARKEHKCCMCGKIIAEGDIYTGWKELTTIEEKWIELDANGDEWDMYRQVSVKHTTMRICHKC